MKTYIGKIIGFGGNPLSGLWNMLIAKSAEHHGPDVMPDFPTLVHFSSGYGARAFAAAYGSLDGAVGRTIAFVADEFGVLEAFTPIEEWDPEVGWTGETAEGEAR